MGRIDKVASGAAQLGKRTAVGYWRGLTYPFRGMAFVFFKHPGLVRFWIWPILITIVVLVLVSWSVWTYSGDVVTLVWTEPVGDGFWDGVARFFHGFVAVLVGILLFFVGLILVTLLTTVFAAPFNDLLSEEVERILTGRAGPKFTWTAFLGNLIRTILLEIAKLTGYFVVMGPLFVLSFVVPVVGQIVYSIFGFLFTAMYWAIDYVDWPATRADRGIRYRMGLARRHFLPMFGFGTGVWLFLFVPFLNLLFMPAAVAGGTMLYLDLEAEGGAAAPTQGSS